ncbi:MAG: beta-lactamase family protein [Alphaproteobacteria bacterium]|nr:beta-lactamase family protein [Alphaproteobacteria bacterium]
MKKFALAAFAVLVGIGGLLALAAPHPPEPPEAFGNLAAMDAYFEALTSAGDPPGLSLAVVRDGQIVLARSYGTADATTGTPVTNETVFHWWSMTKLATAAAVLRLTDEGRLGLDDPVVSHLPFFSVEGPDGSQSVTIRHLLDHSSGLGDAMPDMMGWIHYDDAPKNQTDLLRAHLPRFAKLQFAPGTGHTYTNFGYMALGAVIEAVTGESYENHIARSVLAPLAMKDSAFIYPAGIGSLAAAGSHPLVHFFTPFLPFLLDVGDLVKERIGTRLWFNPLYIDATPPTGLIGTAEDAARLLWALSEKGGFLSSQSIALMRNEKGRMPLAWADFADGDRPWLQHRGGGPGFAAIMRLYPEEGLGFVLLANGTNLDGESLVVRLAEMEWAT